MDQCDFVGDDLVSSIQCADKKLDLSRPRVMGILNLTPDSLFDAGQYCSKDLALARVEAMIQEGADIIDIGAESTRPFAKSISLQEELDRIADILVAIKQRFNILLSVDTYKPQVMLEALKLGVHLINDIYALRLPGALEVMAASQAAVILMHLQNSPATMQIEPTYSQVVSEVGNFLNTQINVCLRAGIQANRIVIDPGFGFGKTTKHNMQLLRNLAELSKMGYPILVGLSRKASIGALLSMPVEQRLYGSISAHVIAAINGASIIRTHDIKPTVEALKIAEAVLQQGNIAMAVKKYFGTDGIRGRVGESLINPSFVLKLGWAIGAILGKKRIGKVLIGKDTRISGYMLESALEAGLSSAGMNIHLLGPMPTPAIAYLTRTLRAEAGIVISASHNAYHDNGIKLFSSHGVKLPDSLELAIEQQLEKPMMTVDSARLGKAARIVDAPGRYIEFCKSTVHTRVNLAGLKIVVDCANGATYHIAPDVFRELGAEVIEIGTDPDGFNINENCGSTKPKVLQEMVLAEKADVGVALDGDGDRVILVDHKGEVVDGDEALYIIVSHLSSNQQFQGGVVGTAMSNLGLELALKKIAIPFKRTQVGDRYVMAELNKSSWVLGGEPSGHIVHLGLTTTGDGIISALQVLSAMCNTEKTLAELKAGMTKYPQILINVNTTNADRVMKSRIIRKLIKDIEIKLGHQGRVLLRQSGTEPVIRVMVEGERKQMVHVLAKELAAMVQKECA